MNDLKGIIEDCNKSDLVSDRVIKKVIEIIGQEEWQILHDENNDVCTTMGELIITLKGIADLEKENAELKSENQKWKDEWQEQVQKATDEGYARTLQTVQLSKSKEIIKKFLLWENDWHDKTESKYELLKQAEQFIKDSEVEK